MVDGGIVVGEKPTKQMTAIMGDLAKRAGTSVKDRRKVCRAMTQQRAYSGQPSIPQKFVRLVGCHDPNAGPTARRENRLLTE